MYAEFQSILVFHNFSQYFFVLSYISGCLKIFQKISLTSYLSLLKGILINYLISSFFLLVTFFIIFHNLCIIQLINFILSYLLIYVEKLSSAIIYLVLLKELFFKN